MPSGGGHGRVVSPPPPHPSLFKTCRVFLQNVSEKFTDSVLLVNLEYFITKKRNAEFYQSPKEIKILPAMTAFKKSYKNCTDDYDNNEYLAMKYIRFFTKDFI